MPELEGFKPNLDNFHVKVICHANTACGNAEHLIGNVRYKILFILILHPEERLILLQIVVTEIQYRTTKGNGCQGLM